MWPWTKWPPILPVAASARSKFTGLSAPEIAKISSRHGFFEKIEGDLAVTNRSGGEAAAVHGDALAEPEIVADSGCGDPQLCAPPGRANPADMAHFLNKSGKHGAGGKPLEYWNKKSRTAKGRWSVACNSHPARGWSGSNK